MRLRLAPLEEWLRDYYFAAEIDVSASGVQPYSMRELREKTGVGHDLIDDLVFDDGYSLGAPPVRAAIAERWGDGRPEKVMTTVGSSEAISLVLDALLRPDDEVVVVDPGYHLLIDYVVARGCTMKVWRLEEENGWRPELERLAELVTERTRAIIVNFPQNPTGASIDAGGMREVVRQAERVGAYLLWDGAFSELTYEEPPLPDVSTLYERGIGFGTFSKAFGLPGLRFGWCIAPPELLAECVRIRDYTTLHLSPLVELLALRVLENADAFIGPRLAQARANREIVRQWAAADPEQVSLVLPSGGVSAFPRLNAFEDTRDFSEDLFHKRGVLVIPGRCFGAPRHIRLGFGGPTGRLVTGLERLTEGLTSRW